MKLIATKKIGNARHFNLIEQERNKKEGLKHMGWAQTQVFQPSKTRSYADQW